jgi:hypothetical protein
MTETRAVAVAVRPCASRAVTGIALTPGPPAELGLKSILKPRPEVELSLVRAIPSGPPTARRSATIVTSVLAGFVEGSA